MLLSRWIRVDQPVEEDRDLSESFRSGLDDQPLNCGILRTSSGFAIPKTAQTLCEALNGNIRQALPDYRDALAAVVRRMIRRSGPTIWQTRWKIIHANHRISWATLPQK